MSKAKVDSQTEQVGNFTMAFFCKFPPNSLKEELAFIFLLEQKSKFSSVLVLGHDSNWLMKERNLINNVITDKKGHSYT